MTNKDIYKIWTPQNAKWVDWVRPVPFVAIKNNIPRFYPSNILFQHSTFLNNESSSTAIIVDLQGTQSIEIGISLTKYGYRPIPLFNGTIEQEGIEATSDNDSILGALVWGAFLLLKSNLSNNAPPAFLLDTNRLQRHRNSTSVFDNSWDIYHQDLPSEKYFLQNGITKIIVISNKLSKDLKSIFKQYPQKKISIFLTDGYNKLKCIRKGK